MLFPSVFATHSQTNSGAHFHRNSRRSRRARSRVYTFPIFPVIRESRRQGCLCMRSPRPSRIASRKISQSPECVYHMRDRLWGRLVLAIASCNQGFTARIATANTGRKEGGGRGTDSFHLSDTGGGHRGPDLRLSAGVVDHPPGPGHRSHEAHRQVGGRWGDGVPGTRVPGARHLRGGGRGPARCDELTTCRRTPTRSSPCPSFLGAFCSALAGYFGMKTATAANTRTAAAARKGLNDALQVAFKGGSVMGLSVAGSGVARTRRPVHRLPQDVPRCSQRRRCNDAGSQHPLRVLPRRVVHRAVRTRRRRHLHQGGRCRRGSRR